MIAQALDIIVGIAVAIDIIACKRFNVSSVWSCTLSRLFDDLFSSALLYEPQSTQAGIRSQQAFSAPAVELRKQSCHAYLACLRHCFEHSPEFWLQRNRG